MFEFGNTTGLVLNVFLFASFCLLARVQINQLVGNNIWKQINLLLKLVNDAQIKVEVHLSKIIL